LLPSIKSAMFFEFSSIELPWAWSTAELVNTLHIIGLNKVYCRSAYEARLWNELRIEIDSRLLVIKYLFVGGSLKPNSSSSSRDLYRSVPIKRLLEGFLPRLAESFVTFLLKPSSGRWGAGISSSAFSTFSSFSS
jgi:hypothetical protein